MKAVCPNNKDHKEFYTTANVMQDWKVDEKGNWLDTVDESVQTSSGPNPDNIWTCAICSTEAKVE